MKRKIKESESEAGQVTIDKVIGNNNAPTKKTRSLKLSLNEVLTATTCYQTKRKT